MRCLIKVSLRGVETVLQRLRSVGGGRQESSFGVNASSATHPIEAPTPKLQSVADIAQCWDPVSHHWKRTHQAITDAVAFAFLRFPSARRFWKHHRFRRRGSLPSWLPMQSHRAAPRKPWGWQL